MPHKINISGDQVRKARREKGLTQSELALKVGSAQSAISMFESGREDALSDDRLRAVAEFLGLAIEGGVPRAAGGASVAKYCPAHDCPSNVPYSAGGQVCFLVSPLEASASEATRCRLCGEVLESRCPNAECAAAILRGAFCGRCGAPYIAFALPAGETPARYVARRQDEIRNFRDLTQTRSAPARSPFTTPGPAAGAMED